MVSDEKNESSQATHSPERGHEPEDQIPVSSDVQEQHSDVSHIDDENPPLPAEELPPPLPDENPPPPLPSEAPPQAEQSKDDDGWEPIWDDNLQAYYFHNTKTGVTQWENPRVIDTVTQSEVKERPHGGYNPAIHGNYDPTASYALDAKAQGEAVQASSDATNTTAEPDYSAAGRFNRFTGKWQAESIKAENFTDEAKSNRQMSAFFDVDAAANTHDGRSLKAERANKKLSKKELKAFKEKRKERKEEKRRAWLRD